METKTIDVFLAGFGITYLSQQMVRDVCAKFIDVVGVDHIPGMYNNHVYAWFTPDPCVCGGHHVASNVPYWVARAGFSYDVGQQIAKELDERRAEIQEALKRVKVLPYAA